MSTYTRIPAWAGYGSGVYVRSLALTTPAPGRVCLAMEDTFHAFQITLTHEGGTVSSVVGRWERHPLTSCAGAGEALQQMVGTPLSDSLAAITSRTDARQQCTHMYDMACLAALHAHQGRPDLRFDVLVPDADTFDGAVTATLSTNGQPQLSLTISSDWQIAEPAALRGVSVLKGFMKWVGAHLPAEDYPLYFMLQKALFVSGGQRLDLGAMDDQPGHLSGPPAGTCFGSQPERYADARRAGPPRRFDRSNAHEVLQFFKPH
jgi:hypothetical protein